MKRDLISVIVPIYNVEKYLRQCIESIHHQTYQNLEIILVDDGSTDNCGKLCDEFAKKDARMKVIHKENGGLSDARNAGIHIATGKYLSFIDSDDFVHKQLFEILYKEMIQQNADIVFCDYIKFVDKTKIKIEEIQNYKTILHDKYSFLDLYYDCGHKHEKAVVAWGKLYKKELFENIRYPKGKRGEDELTHYKIVNESQKIVEIKLKLYYYLTRKDSLSSDWYTKPRHYMVEALEKELKYFEAKNEKSIEIMVANKLLRELKHNYNLKLKSTKPYAKTFQFYYEKYKNKIKKDKFDEFYKKISD